jgi:hypothetical protein
MHSKNVKAPNHLLNSIHDSALAKQNLLILLLLLTDVIL